jgi:glutathionylspermidine synthase
MIPDTLNDDQHWDLRNRVALNHFKWDPQVGDVSTLAPFPLLINNEHLKNLWHWSQKLSEELFAAEDEVLENPELLCHLGLPSKLQLLLSSLRGTVQSRMSMRILRFDFHYTKDGWKISEVNSDVPGGFTEATTYTQLMCDYFPGLESTGLPGDILCNKITSLNKPNPRIVLLSAPGYMEDYQVVSYIANCLRSKGCEVQLGNPTQIVWNRGEASFKTRRSLNHIDAIFRFFQAEWLPLLPKHSQWQEYFLGNRTPVLNPGIAVIGESKRLPLIWKNLKTPMATWRSLLPETRPLREVSWESDDNWLLKTAYSNTGDSICIREFLSTLQWNKAKWEAKLNSKKWLAQKRFEPIPIDTPIGKVYPCLGVYTIDGIPAGIYGRLGIRQWCPSGDIA